MAVVAFGGRVSGTDPSLDVQAITQHCQIPTTDLRHVALAEPNAYAPGHFLAVDHEHRTIVFAIRGTWTMADLITDLSARYVPFLNGHAHGGIVRSVVALVLSLVSLCSYHLVSCEQRSTSTISTVQSSCS